MIARKHEPFLDCDVFHTSGNLISDDVIAITGNFYATGGIIKVAGIKAQGDIILEAACISDENFIIADFLHAGGKIIIRNFENDVLDFDAEEGIFFSFEGPCCISPVNNGFFADDFFDDDDTDGEYAIQDGE